MGRAEPTEDVQIEPQHGSAELFEASSDVFKGSEPLTFEAEAHGAEAHGQGDVVDHLPLTTMRGDNLRSST